MNDNVRMMKAGDRVPDPRRSCGFAGRMGGSLCDTRRRRTGRTGTFLRTPADQGQTSRRVARHECPGSTGVLRNVPVLRVFVVLAVFLGAALPPSAHAADLFLTGEREIYLAVDKLNAMGLLPGFLANTRPYSVAAVRAALDNNNAASPGYGFDAQLARWISYATRSTAFARGTAGVDASEKRETRANEGGVPTPKGVSARLSAIAREEVSPNVSAHASAAAFFGQSGDTGTRVGETAIEAGIPYASLQAGKIATWYGPGRRGALIFTNNAQSYPGVRLRNPVPIPLTGFFSFLGNVQYDIFLARLEGDRSIPRPLLSGMRLAARPNRYLEVGLSRAIHYGGEGHGSGLTDWWRSFLGTRDNQEGFSGNQLGGFDVTVTLPSPSQPVQAYLEMAGEDEAKILGTPIPGPTKWAYVGGVFLPALLGNPAFDLRLEYADNHRGGDGAAWYTHGSSGNGYAHFYRGRVLGHPMGTDAKDLSVQGHYFLLPSTYIEATLARTDRYASGPERERTNRTSAGLVGWLSERVRAEGEIALEKVDNPGGLPGSAASDASFRVGFSYQPGWGR
ncbi:MAG: capsule assembly Wzi family protein [Deltaproteobacteria bacterium]|nr:MAG: capsule assembly Wzi family protein [Deltaproteobacteria bacterium]